MEGERKLALLDAGQELEQQESRLERLKRMKQRMCLERNNNEVLESQVSDTEMEVNLVSSEEEEELIASHESTTGTGEVSATADPEETSPLTPPRDFLGSNPNGSLEGFQSLVNGDNVTPGKKLKLDSPGDLPQHAPVLMTEKLEGQEVEMEIEVPGDAPDPKQENYGERPQFSLDTIQVHLEDGSLMEFPMSDEIAEIMKDASDLSDGSPKASADSSPASPPATSPRQVTESPCDLEPVLAPPKPMEKLELPGIVEDKFPGWTNTWEMKYKTYVLQHLFDNMTQLLLWNEVQKFRVPSDDPLLTDHAECGPTCQTTTGGLCTIKMRAKRCFLQRAKLVYQWVFPQVAKDELRIRRTLQEMWDCLSDRKRERFYADNTRNFHFKVITTVVKFPPGPFEWEFFAKYFPKGIFNHGQPPIIPRTDSSPGPLEVKSVFDKISPAPTGPAQERWGLQMAEKVKLGYRRKRKQARGHQQYLN